MNIIPLSIVYQGMLLKGYATAVGTFDDVFPSSLSVHIQGWFIGTLSKTEGKWTMDQPIDSMFVEVLGSYIVSYMQAVKKEMSY